jgi:hypothetical protein
MANAIKITDYVYSCGVVCFAEMQDGDSWQWTSDIIEKCYNCYMLTGTLIMSRSSDPDFVPYECGVTGQFSRGDVLDDTQVAKGYTSWICISKLPNKQDRNFELQKVENSYTLSSGTGFIVLEGSVSVNGIDANQFQYFRPRDTDVEVTGTATLALVT